MWLNMILYNNCSPENSPGLDQSEYEIWHTSAGQKTINEGGRTGDGNTRYVWHSAISKIYRKTQINFNAVTQT